MSEWQAMPETELERKWRQRRAIPPRSRTIKHSRHHWERITGTGVGEVHIHFDPLSNVIISCDE